MRRTYFWLIVLTVVLAITVPGAIRVISILRNAAIVTAQVEALDGSIGVWADPFYGPKAIYFSPAIRGQEALVTDDDLIALAPHLRKLNIHRIDLTNTQVTDRGVESLVDSCGLTLRTISLSGTTITDESLRFLERCPRLRLISVPVSVLTDASIRSFASMDALREIIVYGCKPTDDRVRALQEALGGNIVVKARERAHALAEI